MKRFVLAIIVCCFVFLYGICYGQATNDSTNKAYKKMQQYIVDSLKSNNLFAKLSKFLAEMQAKRLSAENDFRANIQKAKENGGTYAISYKPRTTTYYVYPLSFASTKFADSKIELIESVKKGMMDEFKKLTKTNRYPLETFIEAYKYAPDIAFAREIYIKALEEAIKEIPYQMTCPHSTEPCIDGGVLIEGKVVYKSKEEAAKDYLTQFFDENRFF